MNAILAREIEIQLRAGVTLDDALDFVAKFKHWKGGADDADVTFIQEDPDCTRGRRRSSADPILSRDE